jgi:cytochrome c5
MARILPVFAAFLLLGVQQAASAVDGKALYATTCIACHGPKAQGAIPGVPDLAKGGRLAKSDAELSASILNGFQTKGSPMAMPPKGGNPSLTAEDAKTLVLFLRTLTAPTK